MTDGILLAEIQTDRELRRYDTIIIDEAHERSLNIDFLLGYLKQLLPRRPDLKVVITSATIDPERFSRHFGDAPIVEVSGRTYPVEVRYRPLSWRTTPRPTPTATRSQAICDAVDELQAEGPGDILVFLSRRAGDPRHRRRAARERELPHTEVLPLYARLSPAEQHRVFQPHTGRRIVLATNVAETSLTVPGIRYVIDPGTARISRYSHRTKVQRLPIEPISQASANQRKGRCGRTSDGICIRLYSEEDFESRPEFTDPEILRTNLASVILQMAALGLGDIEAFPFIDPPDRRRSATASSCSRNSARSTQERTREAADPGRPAAGAAARRPAAGADGRWRPRRNGCVREVMVIAAALSIQDPRERPLGEAAAGRPAARPLRGPELRLPRLPQPVALPAGAAEGAVRPASSAGCAGPSTCNYLRIREWQDIHSQLPGRASTLGVQLNSAAGRPQRVHTSLLAGLLSHIGLKDTDEARVSRRPRRQVRGVPRLGAVQEAAALGDVGRARGDVAAVGAGQRADRAGVGRAARPAPGQAHLQRAALGDASAAAVMAYEKVTLYGVPIVAARKVNYGRDRPGAVAGAVHPPRARRGRLAHTTTSSSTRTASCWTRSRSWSTAPAAATSSSTTRRCSTSTTSALPAQWSPARTSTPGGRRRGDAARPARLRDVDARHRARRGVRRGRLPRHLAAGDAAGSR